VSSALYNANNQLTKWGTTNISYDLSGNMSGDGVNTYSWNARDQLSAVTRTGVTLPTFTYDAFGRRQKKTLGAIVTSYLFDGANAVQELTGATPSANMLTGLGVDELFQRAEGATIRTALSDALGGTLALADSSGVVQSSYTYAPYGETTVTGTASNNTSQYTGRENDSDGLYFYRARYYHPVFSRFVSEDSIGFGGGDPNLYAYAHDSPTNFTDPTGHCVPMALLTAALDLGDFVLAGRKSQKSFGDWLGLGVHLALDFACVGVIARLGTVARIGVAMAGALGRGRAEMSIIRMIAHGERTAELVNELKGLTFKGGVEHAIVSLKTGGRAIVSGGPSGIDLGDNVRRVIGHTHGVVTGPSQLDLDMLGHLHQTYSYLIEIGRPTVMKFRAR
jgi:RHS repeat-associated protein